ncbi:hypothetical protein FQN53_005309 [Emmonsiellopsis sp. PD_33]|nr:hypothetical protein FQN53_005309 [Emmonsiellopsis sp. PD_33]
MGDTTADEGKAPSPPNESSEDDTISLTIHHRSTNHIFTFPPTSTLQDLSEALSTHFSIPPTNQKILISPKPGLQKPPFPPTPLSSLPISAPRFKITLLGSTTAEITALNTSAPPPRPTPRIKPARPAPRSRTGISTLNSPSSSSQYTFHSLKPLPYLPNPSRSLTYLSRLRDDPGIRATMAKHKFSVPLLTEMDPIAHTTSDSRTLGLNRNKGEVIELRLRTDAYDGYRDYRTIRKTLCHELAHCVFSEHDGDFWALTGQIEKEVERGDYWGAGGGGVASGYSKGRGLGEEEFYNPGDWEGVEREGLVWDEGGWTGGEFVLGGGGEGVQGLSRREILAQAAERRVGRGREKEGEKEAEGKMGDGGGEV